MKNIILLLFLTLFISCTSKEDKAKETIDKYLYYTLHDYKSYEPVSWSKLDSLYSDYTMDDSYIDLEAIRYMYDTDGKECKERLNKVNYDLEYRNSKQFIEDLLMAIVSEFYKEKVYLKKLDSIKVNFNPQFIGYKITHTYRAKNLNGAYKLSEETFFLDKSIEHILPKIEHIADSANLIRNDFQSTLELSKNDPNYKTIIGIVLKEKRP